MTFDQQWQPVQRNLMNYAVRLCDGNVDAAHDLYQDSRIRIWGAYPSFDGRAKFYTWASTIVKSVWIDSIRKAGRKPRTIAFEDMGEPGDNIHEVLPDGKPCFSVNIIEKESFPRLNEKESALFWGHLEGLTPKELSPILGIPVNTVKSRLHHLRVRLCNQMEISS